MIIGLIALTIVAFALAIVAEVVAARNETLRERIEHQRRHAAIMRSLPVRTQES